MSIKTLRKRIALVAVSALGVGLLSVAPASAGDSLSVAKTATGGIDTQTAGNSGICGYFSETGAVLTTAEAETTVTDSTSLGTVVMAVGGEWNLAVSGAATVVTRLSGTKATFVDKDGSADGVSNGGLLFDPDDTNDTITVRGIAVGAVTVKTYTDITTTTALSTVAVSVVATCANTTLSAADSVKEWGTAAEGTIGNVSNTASVFTYENGDVAYLSTFTKNAYGSFVTPGTWMVSSTNNCVVGISSSTTITSSGVSAALLTLTDGDGVFVSVSQGTANADVAVNCVVTLMYGSTVVDSTTIKFTGDVATITVSGADVQYNVGSTQINLYNAIAKDAAGNQIQVAFEADPASLNQDVTAITSGYTSTTLPLLSTSTADDTTGAGAKWTCRNGFSGSVDVRIRATNVDGDYVYSNVFKASCGGDKYTFTAALDKAVYNPGDIATLTITAKDSAGKAPSKHAPISGAIGSGVAPAFAGAGLTLVGSALAADVYNANADGTYTYKFTVGSAADFEGKANLSVGLTGYSGMTSAVSVPYEVKSTSTAVTNAEVLAAIVKLIASINKQIRALQKSLKR